MQRTQLHRVLRGRKGRETSQGSAASRWVWSREVVADVMRPNIVAYNCKNP